MKKLAYVLGVMLAFGAGALITKLLTRCLRKESPRQTVQEPKPEDKAENTAPAPAGYALKPARHDFGRMFEGEAREVELALDRPAEAPLRMGRLYSACPCIRVDAAPRFVEAGKPAKVKVQVHSLSLEGKQSFPVYVELLEPAKCVLRADVSLEVQRVPAKLMLAPETFHLGSVSADKTASVTLTNLTKYPMHLQELTSSLAGSTIELRGQKALNPGEAVEIVLNVPGKNFSAGPIRGEVQVKTDCPQHALVTIPVDGTVTR